VPPIPLLFQVNTRVTLGERARDLGRPATLDDLPDAWLDSVADQGYQWVWLLGLWQTGEAGRQISRSHPGLREECARVLPDLVDEDISGSPFAIREYRVHADFGGNAALARLRKRMGRRGLKLMADFVVNHGAPDHPWLETHPEWFILGSESDRAREPANWIRLPAGPSGRPAVVAHGRDPYFPGWPDTVQFNLRHPGCREALLGELERLADLCDGLRCDMAMLAQNDVFRQTWGDRSLPADGALPSDLPFWPEAIRRVKAAHPAFMFLAEVYWDREGQMQAEGFDFTYDKRLYDRLRRGDAAAVRAHLRAEPSFQERSMRFLENHDEERAALAFPPAMHRAAALVAFLVPGLKLVHQGQTEGRRIRISMHLGRRPVEPVDPGSEEFYARLLESMRLPDIQEGRWSLVEPMPAWEGNVSCDGFLAFRWRRPGRPGALAVINYSAVPAQCRVRLDDAGTAEKSLRLRDLFSEAVYVRERKEAEGPGIYFDMPPWGFQFFEMA
jgi:hypothetical protein